jgi:hypothetical protein
LVLIPLSSLRGRRAWLLSLPSTIVATLPTTRSASLIMIGAFDVHQRSRHPILHLNYWTRTVEDGARKTFQLPPPALRRLFAILSNRTLRLIRKMNKVELVTAVWRSSGMTLRSIFKTRRRSCKSNNCNRR